MKSKSKLAIMNIVCFLIITAGLVGMAFMIVDAIMRLPIPGR